jgi:endonuclease YncB( thermonuclease family)
MPPKPSQALETQNIIILVILIFFFIITISLYFITNQNLIPSNNQTKDFPALPPTPTPTSNTVTRIIDGDTFQIYSGEIIRLLCIDTPEQGKKGSEKAKQFLEDLILNKEVRLEKDISETDKYGRLLRYVYVNLTRDELINVMQDGEDGALVSEEQAEKEIFINKEMMKESYATIFEVEPDITKCNEIER